MSPASDDTGMDELESALTDLDPAPGTVETAELVVSDDVLVKLFALGPGAELDPHEHGDSTNVFHIVEGTVTVVRDGETESLAAPAVVRHDRGVSHGARNETDERAIFTASLCPLPGSG
jgi:quercetin dioxygenase-like cupin family protein